MKTLLDFTPEQLATFADILRSDFKLYIRTMFPIIANRSFVFKPFHDLVISKLQNISNSLNVKRNLMINIPIGSGKSILIELWISWNYARNINNKFCYISHANDLIKDLSSETRDIIMSEEWQLLFNSPLELDDKSKNSFSFQGANIRTGLTAKSMGGGLTGFDAGDINPNVFSGALIIDDPVDTGNIRYENFRDECISLYINKLSTRRRNPRVPSILIMQRLHVDDLCGYLLRTEPDEWDVIKIPAIDGFNRSFWEERFTIQEMELIKEKYPIKFYAQYQQDPIFEKGSVINVEWFNKYNPDTIDEFERIFIVGDTAQKTKEWNDYSVFSAWGVLNNNLYLIDGVRDRWEAPRLKSEAINFWKRFEYYSRHVYCYAFYIEDKSSGTGLIQELNHDTSIPIIPIQRVKDKLTRIEDVLDYIHAGRIHLPINNKFSDSLIAECMAFTRDVKHNKHDDMIDTMIDAINKSISMINISILDVI
jgi:predicted phage terminase large subunit-like protein